ncbi:MAG: MBL fold metallo-hydrolase [Clostridiales bacterium]|nr:MBL fold metallo-hydrolase [Clostridiales bacterium]
MAKLLYQGHGSYRITAKDGFVAYVDPYAGKGYDLPADLILVTHQHGDHNAIDLPAKKPGCLIISNEEALEGGRHNSFEVGGLSIRAVHAENRNHDPKKCVGFLILVDGILIYASGDTSKNRRMEALSRENINYALLPGDGIYNMDLDEAAECAEIIGAKHNIPVHLKPGQLFDRKLAQEWKAPNKLIIDPGEEIELG